MNKKRTIPLSGPVRILLSTLALAILGVGVFSGEALASTAANAVITNTVTVNYDDTSGVAQTAVTDSSTVTIQLVAATPTLSAPADQSTDYGTDATYSYTLTSNANGPDTYDLTETITDETGITGSSVSLSVASLDLGATTLAAATDGSATITVPYDGSADGTVNGIAAGDTIVIGGTLYTVATGGISENAGTNLAEITLTANVSAGTGAGAIVGEQQSFTLTVTPGSDPGAAEGATIDVQVTAQDSNDTEAAATDDTTTTVINVPTATLTVSKEVSTNGGTSFAASANAVPGNTLTYRITVTNGSASDATNVVITDPEPQFTTYVGGSAEATTTGAAYGAATVLSDTGADGDGYDFDVTTTDTVTYSAGNLAPGVSVILYFQVTVD